MPQEKLKSDQLDVQDLAAKGKKSLFFFCKAILGFTDLVPHIHKPICDLLEDHSKNRKAFVLPRGWFKSTITTIGYALWEAVRDPNVRVLIVQNTAANAEKKLGAIKKIVEGNDLFRACYPEILPKTLRTDWGSQGLKFNRKAAHPELTIEAAGIGAKLTSRHYDIIIEDDTSAPDEDAMRTGYIIPSQEEIEKAIGFHQSCYPLLVNIQQGIRIVTSTRWKKDDLMSWIKSNEQNYFFVERSCREDEKGRSDPNGSITYPERFSLDVLQELESSMGPYNFSCLYLNTPLRPEDQVFKEEWVLYYEVQPRDLMVYTTIDLAGDPTVAKGRDLDYNVVMTCGKSTRTGEIYILDYFRRRCSPGEVIDALFQQVKFYSPVMVGWETVAYQSSFAHYVRERMKTEDKFFSITPVKNNTRSKHTRISGLQPLFSNKQILIKRHMKDLVTELLSFPNGSHDDLIDTLSMQIPMWALLKVTKQKAIPEIPHIFSFDRVSKHLRDNYSKSHSFFGRIA